MIVHSMDPADLFPYKQPQMEKVFGAFQEMLKKAAHGALKRREPVDRMFLRVRSEIFNANLRERRSEKKCCFKLTRV